MTQSLERSNAVKASETLETPETLESQTYDAIVIGSGIGGLTTAALLAKVWKKKVLVLEQHFMPGGCTHAFKRKGGYHWDVGLHYVGEMGQGSMGRAIFNYISDGRLQWQKIADPFERFVYPDFSFEVHSDPDRYLNDLIQRYPAEEQAIRQYFKDVQTASFWIILHNIVEVIPGIVRPLMRWIFKRFGTLAVETTQSYLDRNFKDETLKALLVSQWGDHGLPPAQSSFGIHSTIVAHYLEGAWYPLGGGPAIAQSIIPTIEKAGGKVLTKQQVTEVLIESGVAKGVKAKRTGASTERETCYYASTVISGAGLYTTYSKLIPPQHDIPGRNALTVSDVGQGVLTLYLGLKKSPQTLGFNGENIWIYTSYKHEDRDDLGGINQSSESDLSKIFSSCYITFPSMKDSLAQAHTAEIIVGGHYDDFTDWNQKNWRTRGDDYESFKEKISQAMIQFVESHFPGFEDLVEYHELATPLTYKHFIDNQKGEIYGLSYSPQRFENNLAQAKTPIKNLFLTGGDTFVAGIVGAMYGGVKAASLSHSILGLPLIVLAILFSNKSSDADPEKDPAIN